MELLLKTLAGLVLCATVALCARSCGGDYRGPAAAFASPHYPERYPNNQLCSYTFRTGRPITITCPDFSLQKQRKGKCRDKFTIHDAGMDTVYCGGEGPKDYKSIGGNVSVVFKSNKKGRKTGFYCLYETRMDATTTTTTTTTTPSPPVTMPESSFFSTALQHFESGICNPSPKSRCGCPRSLADAEFYTAMSGAYRVVITNNVPSHEYDAGKGVTPRYYPCPHHAFMGVPAKPTKGNAYMPYEEGVVGVALSGGFFYNQYSYRRNDVTAMLGSAGNDICNGHSDHYCRYRYRNMPLCAAGEGMCAVVGYMLDGFPIYMYCNHDYENRPLKSCYYLNGRGDGSLRNHFSFNGTAYYIGQCDLDRANGYRFPDKRGYGYIFTDDYPFVMAGHYGTELGEVCYL